MMDVVDHFFGAMFLAAFSAFSALLVRCALHRQLARLEREVQALREQIDRMLPEPQPYFEPDGVEVLPAPEPMVERGELPRARLLR